MNKYEIEQFRSDRGCLSYIINDTKTKQAILIDPSEEVQITNYLDYLKENQIDLVYIIDTHTHADHISSSKEIKKETGAKIIMHKNSPTKRKDIEVCEDMFIDLGELRIELLYTPGHTDESISILIDGAVFTGDALLIGGTGRTDFQAGSSESLFTTLHEKFEKLDDSTKVYPAHNYEGKTNSTIEEEKKNNPRFKMKKDEFIKTLNAHKPDKPDLFKIAIEKNSQ